MSEKHILAPNTYLMHGSGVCTGKVYTIIGGACKCKRTQNISFLLSFCVHNNLSNNLTFSNTVLTIIIVKLFQLNPD